MADARLDVIVLGGGPAGCAAATLLAGWGHAVRLVTKPEALAPLAESIPPSTHKLFDLLDVQPALDAAGFVRSTGNTVWWGSGDAREEPFLGGRLGWQVDKGRFNATLLSQAAARGVDVQHTAATRDFDTAAAVFVLDCTGRSGLVARTRQLRIHETGQRTIALTGTWQAGAATGVDGEGAFEPADRTHTLIESYDGGWAWSIPESPARRHVAVMVDPATSDLSRGLAARDIYLTEIRRTTRLAALVQKATLVNGPAGWDASMYHATRYVDGNALLVGDAASFVDPLSSAGVKKALASGWLAAVAVHTALRTPAMHDTALAFYARREAAVYTSLRAMTARMVADAAAGHAHPFWDERRDGGPDPGADLEFATAHARLRSAPALEVRINPAVSVSDRPIVRGTEIVLEPHLVCDGSDEGLRYAFGVDMVGLVGLAPRYGSVPEVFESYSRRYGAVPLPAFLSALATALAQRWLLWV